MFFRRERPKVVTFNDRIALLKKAGFDTAPTSDGRILIQKHGVGAIVGDEEKGHPGIERAGVLIGSKLGILLNAGYQMFLETPDGKRYPAAAEQLRALHQFEDDVKEALDLTNLYNTSLGTTSRLHQYDRITARDAGRQPKPWEKKENRYQAPDGKGSLHI
jgi:hypothetical protein